MKEIVFISDLPNVPAIYAMFGGQGRSRYVAYVRLARKRRGRIEQHLVRWDSSVTTGVSAVSLDPDLVTEVSWWEHPDFETQECLEAAELLAFDVLEEVTVVAGNVESRVTPLPSWAGNTSPGVLAAIAYGGWE